MLFTRFVPQAEHKQLQAEVDFLRKAMVRSGQQGDSESSQRLQATLQGC